MNLTDLQRLCLSKENVSLEYISENILTFKLWDKVFCYCYIDSDPLRIILKCDPYLAQILRAKHPEIKEGYKMNKNSWNTITLSVNLADGLVEELIDHSYELIEDAIPNVVAKPLVAVPRQVAVAAAY
jgi:predicted DNA-binding protein (MmcQ/YjbR family)